MTKKASVLKSKGSPKPAPPKKSNSIKPRAPADGLTTGPDMLKGWKQISEFLGEPASVVERWASSGMPVRRQGRFVTTTARELNDWLGEQSGKPVHAVSDQTDLAAELKRGLAYVRKER